jgi:hypothetical protein
VAASITSFITTPENNARENQRFLIHFVELCIQQWAGQAFAAVPRDCSHSPIVFDLSFVPPVNRLATGSDKSCGWRRCDRRDPLGVFRTPLISGSYFMTCLVLNRAQVCFARLSALKKGLP